MGAVGNCSRHSVTASRHGVPGNIGFRRSEALRTFRCPIFRVGRGSRDGGRRKLRSASNHDLMPKEEVMRIRFVRRRFRNADVADAVAVAVLAASAATVFLLVVSRL